MGKSAGHMAVQGDWELPCSAQNVRGEQVIWRELSSRITSGFGRELTNPVGSLPPRAGSLSLCRTGTSASQMFGRPDFSC